MNFKFLLILIIILFSSNIASATWFNDTYDNKYELIYYAPSYPYQVSVNITNSTIPFANATHLNVSCYLQACADLRFVKDNTTELPFWVETNITSDRYGQVWLNLTSAATTGHYQIYSGATSFVWNASNGTNTFFQFDDFEAATINTDKWTTGGAPSTSGGQLVINGVEYIQSTKTFGLNYSLGTNAKMGEAAGSVQNGQITFMAANPSHNEYLGTIDNVVANKIHGRIRTGGGAVVYAVSIADMGSWYKWEMIRNGTTTADFFVNGTKNQITTTASLPLGDLYVGAGLEAWSNANDNIYVDYIYVRKYMFPENTSTWSTGENSSSITSWTNNYTNNDTLSFTKATSSTPVNFSIILGKSASFINWTVNDVDQSNNATYFNRAFTIAGTYYVNTTVNYTTFNRTLSWTVVATNYTLELLSPANNSVSVSVSPTLIWREWPQNAPYTYQIATDSQFINIVVSGMGTTYGNETVTASISGLSYTTHYYWRVKNNTGSYIQWFDFTTQSITVTPGQFNITVFDEQNTSLRIMNFTTQLSNLTNTIPSKTTTTGWTNYSGSEVSSGEYLIIAIPNSPYYQRMVLATSPGNVTMYVPNSTSPNTIDLVSFSLLDVTGFFPYATSTITLLRGGLIMDKAYFSADGTHPVYLIQGNNYQIQIQNGDNLQSFANFVPLTSATSQIVINDFSPNMTQVNPFIYNMTYNTSEIVLNWDDVGNVLSSLTFTVGQGTNYSSLPRICLLTTSVSHGQSICTTNNNSIYNVSFSAMLTDGTFQNSSFYIDYTKGKRQDSTGISTIDGSPIGIGFKWNYGSFTMPDWVYTWVVLLVLILLAGTFGTYHAGIGGIITLIMALIFEATGLFRPLGSSDPDNLATMGITGGMLVMVILYYLQHRDKGG